MDRGFCECTPLDRRKDEIVFGHIIFVAFEKSILWMRIYLKN